MCVEKIPFTGTSLDDKYTNISDKEIIELHNKIVSAWERSLRKYNVNNSHGRKEQKKVKKTTKRSD